MMFKKAKPVWSEKFSGEYNRMLGFVFTFDGERGSEVLLTACDAYQLYLNGKFLAAGPARCVAGHCRVDRIPLPRLKLGKNVLAVLVAGYGVNCYEYDCAEPFLQLEVKAEDRVLAATGEDTHAFAVEEHMQKVLRYSFQRAFTEVWEADASFVRKLRGEGLPSPLPVKICAEVALHERNSKRPLYTELLPRILSGGCITVENAPAIEEKKPTPLFFEPRDVFKTFPRDELSCDLVWELRCMRVRETKEKGESALTEGEFALFDFGVDGCGFLHTKVRSEAGCTLYILFDEILTEEDVDPFRLDCVNCVKYILHPGRYDLTSFEPYTFRYAKIVCAEGDAEIERLAIREESNPAAEHIRFTCRKKSLEKIFVAALNSFKYNAVDIFMDCPSRERAGWLCDGYFTGRVEHILTGENRVEHDFLENFLLAGDVPPLPEGMLPMCYPAQHPDGVFIPTWAMWFVLELSAYTRETGDGSLAARAKDKLYALTKYFLKYENDEGLLEDLPGWVFIEWSKAAEFANGVNYCVNMLYSYMLSILGELYKDAAFTAKAEELKEVIRRRSYNGIFFCDHSVRENGSLVRKEDVTEVCQYYAFFTGVADPESYPDLFEMLVRDFGPGRKVSNPYPAVWFANAFVGNYLRLTVLLQYGYYDLVLDEIEGYFLYMADKTMTLWEHDGDYASCNHGFASHVICWLLRAATGYCGRTEKTLIFAEDYSAKISADVKLLSGGKRIDIRSDAGDRRVQEKRRSV